MSLDRSLSKVRSKVWSKGSGLHIKGPVFKSVNALVARLGPAWRRDTTGHNWTQLGRLRLRGWVFYRNGEAAGGSLGVSVLILVTKKSDNEDVHWRCLREMLEEKPFYLRQKPCFPKSILCFGGFTLSHGASHSPWMGSFYFVEKCHG